MADEYSYDPNNKGNQSGPGPGPQGPNQQGYNYQYNYSYGPGRGAGYRPPQQDPGAGGWVSSRLNKWLGIYNSQKWRYRQEAQRAAATARDTVADLLNKGRGQSGTDSAPGAGSYQYKKAAQPNQTTAQPDGWNVRDPSENRRQKAKKRAGKKPSRGTGRIIVGGIFTGIFGLGALSVASTLFADLPGVEAWMLLIPIVSCLMFMGIGLGMLFSGIGAGRRGERYTNYLAYIGANREVPLAHMAATFGVSVKKLCKDLRRMLAKGILPTGYLDLAEGKLYLTEMGYRAPEPKREAPPEETAQEAAAREDSILREIRQINDDIPGEVMSAKIDRIEEITGKILKYQKEHPNKEGQLRSFLNYYLPTTLKILRAYAQLDAQGIEGENISAAKKRIEDMMDQVVYGFERQLDKLFQDDAMDITSDVEVLENMLKKDGLSDEGGFTMTL